MMGELFRKMAGRTQSPPRVSLAEVAWSGLGSLMGIAPLAYLNENLLEHTDLLLLIAPFGASAVLIYGAIRSPLAQPRNLLGGHLISALVGVTAWKLLGSWPWLAATLAVTLSIVLMHLLKVLHPPGGATALLAVLGGPKIHQLGYFFVVMPVTVGLLFMLLVALVLNNLVPGRRYPEYWW